MLAMSATGAQAADLGGNCCADLEERIAELEATTARKGNRKVSLTISGWVAEQIGYWDTGEELNIYVGGIGGTLASHVKFTGGAKIDPDNSVGYVLHLRGISTNIFGVSEDDDNSAAANTTALYYSYWFVKNEKLGKISVGQQSQASDNASILPDASGTLVAANWAMFDGAAFQMARNGVGVTDGLAGNQRVNWGYMSYCGFVGLGTSRRLHVSSDRQHPLRLRPPLLVSRFLRPGVKMTFGTLRLAMLVKSVALSSALAFRMLRRPTKTSALVRT